MDKIIEILTELKPDLDCKNETGFIDNGLLDSFDIVQLVQELKDSFDIDITPADIIPENFNSVDAIWEMVQKLS